MNLCNCGFPSIDHWGIYPDGGCVRPEAESCKGFQKGKTVETVMKIAGPSDDLPSITQVSETLLSPAPVTVSAKRQKSDDLPETAVKKRPTKAASTRRK